MTATAAALPAPLLRRLLAVALAVLAGILWYDYPVFKPLLGGFLLVYGALLFRWPLVWLAVLPACVPILQLAHWSGRLFLEDLDIVFVFTLAVLLWRVPASHRHQRLPFAIHLVVFALAVSYLSSLAIGLTLAGLACAGCPGELSQSGQCTAPVQGLCLGDAAVPVYSPGIS